MVWYRAFVWQSQQDVESKLVQILAKIAELESAKQSVEALQAADEDKEAGCGSVRTRKKLEELEAQLSSVTQRRLNYLEKQQQQQFDVQVADKIDISVFL